MLALCSFCLTSYNYALSLVPPVLPHSSPYAVLKKNNQNIKKLFFNRLFMVFYLIYSQSRFNKLQTVHF